MAEKALLGALEGRPCGGFGLAVQRAILIGDLNRSTLADCVYRPEGA